LTQAAIALQGVDEARLGVGALITRPTLEALSGSSENLPEWTVARLAEGASPDAFIAANPEGVADGSGSPPVGSPRLVPPSSSSSTRRNPF
jgi:hypothetical protein